MARNRVEFFVRARDQASAALSKVDGSLRGLLSAQRLFPAFLGAAGLGGIAAGFDRILDRGAKVAGVQAAFERATMGNTEALQGLRTAAGGLIRDYDLMVGFNRALSLGAVQNTQDYQKLIRSAIQLGRAQGVDAGDAVESLTLGLGRQSAAILDNLGITIRAEDAYKTYAEQVGKSVSELDAFEKRQAFMSVAMEQIEARLDDQAGSVALAADAWTQLTTSIGNAIDGIQRFIAESPVVAGVIRGIALEIERWFPRDESALSQLAQGPGSLGADLIASPASIDEVTRNFITLDRIIADLKQRMAEVSGELERQLLHQDLLKANEAFREMIRLQGELQRQAPAAPAGPVAGGGGTPPPPPPMPVASPGFRLPPIAFGVPGQDRIGQFLRQNVGSFAPALGGAGGPSAAQQVLNAWREQAQATAESSEALLAFSGVATGVAVDLADESSALAEAGQVAVASIGHTVAAAIAGFGEIEVAVIDTVSNILQTIAQRESSFLNLGGFGVPVLGAIGGILGAAFRGGPERPVPVRVQEFGESARNDLQERQSGPRYVTLQLIGATTGELVDELQFTLGERQRSDTVIRIPRKIVFGG